MRTSYKNLALLLVAACGPERDPVDEEAYAICEAFYEHTHGCAGLDDITEEGILDCSEVRAWQQPCRTLRRDQLVCFTTLTCDEYNDPMSAGHIACNEAQFETGQCQAEHLN